MSTQGCPNDESPQRGSNPKLKAKSIYVSPSLSFSPLGAPEHSASIYHSHTWSEKVNLPLIKSSLPRSVRQSLLTCDTENHLVPLSSTGERTFALESHWARADDSSQSGLALRAKHHLSATAWWPALAQVIITWTHSDSLKGERRERCLGRSGHRCAPQVCTLDAPALCLNRHNDQLRRAERMKCAVI